MLNVFVSGHTALCRVVARHGPFVMEVEGLGQHKWAIKGIDSGLQAAREAERLCKLQGHPLIVPLHSMFAEGDRLYLQMPFYKNGNLLTWFEQLKVQLKEPVMCCIVLPICLFNNHGNLEAGVQDDGTQGSF